MAERLIQDSELPIETIIQPSLGIGTSDKGIANIDPLVWRLVAGASMAACHNPDEADQWVYVRSANIIAETTLGCLNSLQKASGWRTGALFLGSWFR